MSEIILEEETRSKPAELGDFVVARNDNGLPAEQWLVKASKFSTLYTPIVANIELGPEWQHYGVVPEDRKVLIWNRALTEDFLTYITNGSCNHDIWPQYLFHNFCLSVLDRAWIGCKHASALARPASVGEIVITKVIANPALIELSFMAPWGESMPVKNGDAIVVLADEVYRIARAEFDLTYALKHSQYHKQCTNP